MHKVIPIGKGVERRRRMTTRRRPLLLSGLPYPLMSISDFQQNQIHFVDFAFQVSNSQLKSFYLLVVVADDFLELTALPGEFLLENNFVLAQIGFVSFSQALRLFSQGHLYLSLIVLQLFLVPYFYFFYEFGIIGVSLTG